MLRERKNRVKTLVCVFLFTRWHGWEDANCSVYGRVFGLCVFGLVLQEKREKKCCKQDIINRHLIPGTWYMVRVQTQLVLCVCACVFCCCRWFTFFLSVYIVVRSNIVFGANCCLFIVWKKMRNCFFRNIILWSMATILFL